MVLAMLRIAHFVINHMRFIVMVMLTSSTDVGNVHSLYRKTLWKTAGLQRKDNYVMWENVNLSLSTTIITHDNVVGLYCISTFLFVFNY